MLDLYLLDKNFETVAILDQYISCIWTERWNKYGDFELETVASRELIDALNKNKYFYINQSRNLMIIEKVEINSDPDDGDRVRVSGRSLESILDRRVIFPKQKIDKQNIQNALQLLLNTHIMNPSVPERKIDNFKFKWNYDKHLLDIFVYGKNEYDEEDASVEVIFYGDNLYDVVCNLCDDKKIGFQINIDEAKNYVFEVCSGTDRSYNQTRNSYVVFSEKFENLLSGDFVHSTDDWKNVSMIKGCEIEEEVETEDGKKEWVKTGRNFERILGNMPGLERREMFVDASSIDAYWHEEEEQGYLGDNVYFPKLEKHAEFDMKKHKQVKSFTGEMDSYNTFTCGVDYFVGDVVQVEDQYGNQARSRITEVIWSQDANGYSCYPTFESLDEDAVMA